MFLKTSYQNLLLALLLLALMYCTALQADEKKTSDDPREEFFGPLFVSLVIDSDSSRNKKTLKRIEENWQAQFLPMAIETMYFTGSFEVRQRLRALVTKETDSLDNGGIDDLYFWLWNKQLPLPKDYANFKGELHKYIDPRFEEYFINRQASARIRLDEIRWGGVRQDGIPPLRNPKMLKAKDANYLDDDNIVFGIRINGDARAYPKRILAWHEMFTDTIGGVPIAGVYCTLCGTVIPYRTAVDGKQYLLGTSGFLYRSNKLMYDKATQSLWSTEKGEPVLGPLVDQGIKLPYESVVTTTWGEWKRRNPDTTVLSLKTGYQRDYGEGVAYNEYFSTDDLMFNTPFRDNRLANKQEVLALRFAGAPKQQLAIDTQFLQKNTLYKNAIGAQKFIVLTDQTGANRVYDPKSIVFERYDGISGLVDSTGKKWVADEEILRSEDGEVLPRLPYHRAFWFGWLAAFPETQLIK